MSKKTIIRALLLITLMFLAGLGIIRFKASSTASQQQGYRGTGMAQIDDGDAVQAALAAGGEPLIHKPARVRPNGPVAGTTYKNVQVLTELPIGEFGRTMTAMTDWVAGKDSCNYCHVDGDFASDSKYTKVVARRMLQMVRHVNNTWKPHVGETGVTCYTCHRGNALPSQRWFTPAPDVTKGAFTGHQAQNTPSMTVRLAALPNDPYTAFLKGPETVDEIRVAASAALADRAYGQGQKAVNAEKTYGLMLHVTQALGVNCTFCHNSRAFASWAESSPQRVTAWKGIRMVRDLNNQFMEPLGPTFPANPEGRLGPTGDAAKVNCATCHQGVSKPLKGFQMARHYPGLTLPYVVAAAPAATAAAAPQAPASAASAASPPDSAASAMELMAAARPASSAAPAKPVLLAAVAPAASAVPAPTVHAVTAAAAALPAVAKTAPAVVAATPEAPNCIDLGAAGSKAGSPVARNAAIRQVLGSGRVAFYSAPDKGCEMLGVFAQAGETLEASVNHAGYTAVRYQRPGSGAEMHGWVPADRLAVLAVKPVPVPAPPPPPAPPATALAAAEPEACRGAEAAAARDRQAPAGGSGRRVVTGAGRLQFYAAPSLACRQPGVFILAGEAVEAIEQFGAFTTVRYVNPRTGTQVRGWVASDRLAADAAARERAGNPVVSQAGGHP